MFARARHPVRSVSSTTPFAPRKLTKSSQIETNGVFLRNATRCFGFMLFFEEQEENTTPHASKVVKSYVNATLQDSTPLPAKLRKASRQDSLRPTAQCNVRFSRNLRPPLWPIAQESQCKTQLTPCETPYRTEPPVNSEKPQTSHCRENVSDIQLSKCLLPARKRINHKSCQITN